jgi:DNA polymerase-3 subunit alpha
MGKKKAAEMAKQRSIFLQGATERGVDEKVASGIFDLMEKFAGYGFNKSHSAAYALISYQTAWLKAHFPADFMAAVLSADMDNTDKIVGLIAECRDMQLKVVPPDINTSDYWFTVKSADTIVYGLGAIKGVGQAAIEGMLRERRENGRFEDIYNLCRRVDPRKLNRRTLEALVRAGAMDTMSETRATQMANLPLALKMAEQHTRNRNTGQDDMFGGTAEPSRIHPEKPQLPEWDEEQKLLGEKETLGLYLTGHPITRYAQELDRITSGQLTALVNSAPGSGTGDRPAGGERPVIVAGLVMSMRVRKTQRGGKIAFLTLDDHTARMDVRIFSEVYDRYQSLLAKDRLLVISGTLGVDDYSGGNQVTAQEIFDINQAREHYARRLVVGVQAGLAGNGFANSLAEILQPFIEGQCRVCIDYRGGTAEARLALGDEWTVHPTDELLHRLQELAGKHQVMVEY